MSTVPPSWMGRWTTHSGRLPYLSQTFDGENRTKVTRQRRKVNHAFFSVDMLCTSAFIPMTLSLLGSGHGTPPRC